MRSNTKIATLSGSIRPLLFVTVIIIALLIPSYIQAQADNEQTEAKEEETLISPGIDFTGVQKSDNTIDLKALLKAKVNKVFYKLYSMKVSFVAVSGDSTKELGSVITDRNGLAIFNVKRDLLKTDDEGKLHFKAIFAGNKSAESAEEELAFKPALVTIKPVYEDSVYTVNVKMVEVSNGSETPVPETTVGIYVKRLFRPLKIGEGTTDENGEASVEVKGKLPGDAKGNLVLLAKVDDNELYGNLEAAASEAWGIPVSDKIEELPRALWSPHPPLWMLITFIVLMTAVWGHYIVIVYELFRLRKERPKTTNN